jgi:hypothetical protein
MVATIHATIKAAADRYLPCINLYEIVEIERGLCVDEKAVLERSLSNLEPYRG